METLIEIVRHYSSIWPGVYKGVSLVLPIRQTSPASPITNRSTKKKCTMVEMSRFSLVYGLHFSTHLNSVFVRENAHFTGLPKHQLQEDSQ